jgi:SAM-dependent methyltransferase
MALSEELRARTLARFENHRRAWEENPALQSLYAEWYGRIADALPAPALGPWVEIGSGPGLARRFIPDLELTDLVRAPWHDREVNAEALPFGPASLGALVLLDVLHHLPNPRRFFAEAVRVLRPGGRIVLCEPYMSPVSYPIYKLFHIESLDMRADPLAPAATNGSSRDPFESNQAIPTALFGRSRRAFEEAFPELRIQGVERLAGLSYPASGGFSRGPMLPLRLWAALRDLEARYPVPLMRVFAFRLFAVVERVGGPDATGTGPDPISGT